MLGAAHSAARQPAVGSRSHVWVGADQPHRRQVPALLPSVEVASRDRAGAVVTGPGWTEALIWCILWLQRNGQEIVEVVGRRGPRYQQGWVAARSAAARSSATRRGGGVAAAKSSRLTAVAHYSQWVSSAANTCSQPPWVPRHAVPRLQAGIWHGPHLFSVQVVGARLQRHGQPPSISHRGSS